MADRFQHLFDDLKEEVVGFDRDLRLVYANTAWLNGTGFRPAQVLGRPCYTVLLDEEAACAPRTCIVQEVLRTGRSIELPCQADPACALSSKHPISVSPTLDENGQVVQVFAIAHLRHSQARPQGILPPRQEAAAGLRRTPPLAGSGPAMRLLLDPILDQLRRMVDFDCASITLPEESGWRVVASQGHMPDPERNGPPFTADDPRMDWLRTHQQPLIIPDIREESRWSPTEAREGSRAWLGAPLLSRGQLIGTLSLEKGSPGFYTRRDADLLMVFANQAAITLENAWLLDAKQVRSAQFRLVTDLGQRVLSILDPEALLDHAVLAIQEQFGYHHVDVFLLDPDGQQAIFQASSDRENVALWRSRNLSFRVGEEGIIGHVAASGEPYLANDVYQEPRYIRDDLLPETRSLLAIPIKAGQRVIGVLDLSSDRVNGFDQDDVLVARGLADQLAVGLENARLYEAAEQRVAELEAIRRASLSLTSRLELSEVLESILESTMGLVKEAKDAHIFLFEEGRLRFGAALWANGLQEAPWADPRPEGLTYAVARSGELIVVPDMQTHPLFEDAPPDWVGAIVGLPLRVGSRVGGVMSIAYSQPRDLSEAELRILRLLADQAAAAIENSRLYEEVSYHLEEVQILNKVAQAATSTLDFNEVVRRSVTALASVRSFERVSILLLDETRQELCLHPALSEGGTSTPRESMRIALGKGITGSVAQTGKPWRVADTRQEPRYIAGYPDSLSELCVPLRMGDRVIGVLDVQSTRLDAYSQSDERLLSTLAGQLSTLLENSRLFAETQQRVRELTALMQVSQALNQAEGLETVLNIVLDETFNLTESREGTVILVDPPGSNRLRIVAERGLGSEVVAAFNERPVYAHEGTYRRALQSGQIVEVPDTSADPDFLKDVGSRAKSVTNIPLLTERSAIGLIAVDGLPHDDTTRRLLTALAGIAAAAIDKERLHQETANRLAEVSTLYTVSTQITTSLSLRSVLDAIVSILRLTLDCRSCSIFLLDPADEFLKLEAGSGPSATWRGIARLRVGEGISGRVISERRSIYVPDTRVEPDFIFFDPQIRSLLVVPLIVRNEAVGTLSIDDTQPNAFDDELRLLAIAAAQAAVAIDNAQLYESLQKSYQDLEQAYEDLRELDKIKSELIQNISHELRTPLTFIRGYVELLQDGEMGPLQEEQQAALEIVSNKAEVLSKLVEDIITMQLVSRERLRLEPISLAQMGHVAVRAAQVSAQEAGLVLVDEISDSVPRVWGDRRRLGQVFDNLLQNAIKFSRPGDTITVRTCFEKGSVRAEVQDTGIGISADELSRIFDRFYQVDGTTTRRYGGTGLGLAIVKQIIEAHNGQVGVESELDKGSLFYFTIPPISAEEQEEQ